MKSLLRVFIPKTLWEALHSVRQRWFETYAKASYSQEGEDLILERFLEGRKEGFYVDVGAHHPRRFSNTYRLYLRGWRGLNIDANPGSMRMFRRLRPRDINVEAGVSAVKGEITFHIFNEPALNTFDRELALKRVNTTYTIIKEVPLTTQPLWMLLDQYVPSGTRIDLLTIDVEGFDYEVLQSNDWLRYVPEFVLVEQLETQAVITASNDPISMLLSAQKYSIVAKTMNTLLFKRNP
jgi:FkbM family methyltransferase